jgi:hypothetical protein
MKHQHVASIDVAGHPFTLTQCFFWNLRNMQVFVFMIDNAKTVRTLKNPQGPRAAWTVMKRNPDSEALRIPIHEPIILMCMNGKILSMRENQPTYWLGVNQNVLAHEQLHEMREGRMMRQCMKRFQIENLLIGSLERWVRITACGAAISDVQKRVMVGEKPSSIDQYFGYIAEQVPYISARNHIADEQIAPRAESFLK